MGSHVSITSQVSRPQQCLDVNNFIAWHRRWNRTLGIWELDRELKLLQRTLAQIQEKVIDGSTAKINDLVQPKRFLTTNRSLLLAMSVLL